MKQYKTYFQLINYLSEAQFKVDYAAMDGKPGSSIVDADDVTGAARIVREKGFFPTSVKEIKGAVSSEPIGGDDSKPTKRLQTDKEKVSFGSILKNAFSKKFDRIKSDVVVGLAARWGGDAGVEAAKRWLGTSGERAAIKKANAEEAVIKKKIADLDNIISDPIADDAKKEAASRQIQQLENKLEQLRKKREGDPEKGIRGLEKKAADKSEKISRRERGYEQGVDDQIDVKALKRFLNKNKGKSKIKSPKPKSSGPTSGGATADSTTP